MEARVDRRHHRDVDIAPARRVDLGGGAGLGLRRARIAIEEERAFREAGQGRQRRLMRLIGGDDREHRLGPGQRLRRGRSADDIRRHIVGPLRRPDRGIGRIGLDVVNANARLEARVAAPAVEERARRLAEAKKCDGARADRRLRHIDLFRPPSARPLAMMTNRGLIG